MSEQHKGWIGVDLDGTLAFYDGWKGVEHIGEPVPAMLKKVLGWLEEGKDVRIFTARVYLETTLNNGSPTELIQQCDLARLTIVEWCQKHLGRGLPITCTKDLAMIELWDDRAVGVIPNAGVAHHVVAQYHMKRFLDAVGIPVVDGQNFEVAVDAAIRRVVPTLRGVTTLKAYLEAIADALGYEVRNNSKASDDVRRAFTTVTKAQNLIDV